MKLPSMLLRQLYSFGSLANDEDGFSFSLKNRLSDASLTRILRVLVDGREIPLAELRLDLGDGRVLRADELSPERPIPFALRQVARLRIPRARLDGGSHDIDVRLQTHPFGTLDIAARDALVQPAAAPAPAPRHIPYERDPERNYAPEIVAARQRFVEEFTGVRPSHIAHYSFDPAVTRGNIENFTGVAQVPIGFAGPLRINGEYARGEFLIPLATTEGTLVASYSRGMKVLNLAGGVTCTVSDDRMQRAPVFVFESAREARAFRDWVRAHLAEIRREAESTSHVAKLLEIETYLSNRFAFLRFDFSTGDAAGQNMVGRATFAACSWILEQVQGIRRFYLESNFATDKKTSHVNVMNTRGKRVTAEATIPRDLLVTHLRVEPESLAYHNGVANVGAFMAGVNNNGAHSPNGITAMFIATGQDVANVAEASAAIIYSELTPTGDLYLSITIPSLIVATHGGGTGLATQRECLEILGCTGRGSVNKLAEIVAGVVLAGELSLGAAISSLEWVSAHEKYGRKR
ncbi:MAG TPA: hydroxymethylglutaryl-CoA reductase [Gemmatimonadaceae bacterium]|nr:hydroxymethylglutaryl-CoA reductase [Gemmatimonadaceae bacterium]